MEVKHIQLPDNTVVDINDSRITGIDSIPLGDSTNIISSAGVYNSLVLNGLHPIESRRYEDILATTSNYNTLFPFFQAIPTDWDTPVVVHYRVRATVPDYDDYYNSIHECIFSFFHDTLLAYSCINYIGNTSYKNIYYNSLMRCTPTYKDMGHLIGFNYYSNGDSYSRKCTTQGYGRTFVVDILYIENCTIEWVETCTTVASAISGYVAGTTHYAIGNYNATTQGETHSGDANSNTLAYNIRNANMDLPVTVKTYRYRLLFMSADKTHWVPANDSTSTNATSTRDVIQTPIDPFGQIVYYSTTTIINAEAKPGAGNVWRQYEGLSLGYSFNRTGSALVLTYQAPVYLKCAPQSDGSVIIDDTTPYVQTLPTTSDGKVYIYLGMAYSATNIMLDFQHPVYYHDGTCIRPWVNAPQQVIDSTPTSGSTHLVTSGGVYNALSDKQDILVSGTNVKTINGSSILGSGDLTVTDSRISGIDSTPTASSTNLVTSGGVYAAIPRNTSDLTNDSGFMTGMTILSYGTSTWQNFLDAYTANRVIYCRASANTNPATGDQLRMAFMAYIGGSATTPTSVEFQYYRSVSSHSDSQQGDQVFIYKLDSSGWTVTVREAYTKIVASTGLSSSYSNGVKTITAPNDASPTSGSTKLVQSGGVYTALSGKADKVSNATSGNFAALDANGNLTDSGHKHSDYQATLVSGTNIKTINGEPILGSGDIELAGNAVQYVPQELGNNEQMQARQNLDLYYDTRLVNYNYVSYVALYSGCYQYNVAYSKGGYTFYRITLSDDGSDPLEAPSSESELTSISYLENNDYYSDIPISSANCQSVSGWGIIKVGNLNSADPSTYCYVVFKGGGYDSQTGTYVVEGFYGYLNANSPADYIEFITTSSGEIERINNKFLPITYQTTMPGGASLRPGIVYNFGTLTGSIQFRLSRIPIDMYGEDTLDTMPMHYYIIFDTNSTAPTITWYDVVSWAGNDAPIIQANKHYEISILDGVGIYLETVLS